MFDSLASLDTTKTSWKIKVRVTRMWPSISAMSNSSNGGLKGYNMLLLDDDNTLVHAFVYTENWNNIANVIVEGGIYVIVNFYTKEASGSLRPTSSKIIINFLNSTIVTRLEKDDFMIPLHKFEFIDLSELFALASGYENPDSPPLATDIIGVLEDFEPVAPIQTKYGQRNIARFRITDGRYSHKVSIWGQLAVNTTELYNNISEKPIIAIVTSSKLKIFKSSVQVSTMPSSKIYLNMDSELVDAMRLRLEEDGYKIADEYTIPSPLEISSPVVETITLKELGEKTKTEHLEVNFKCVVKISTVEETINWWYISCPDCYEEVIKIEGRLKCPKCPKYIPVGEKRYKIIVLAGDSTEAYNFVLQDKAVKRMVGQTATKLIMDTQNDSNTGYPRKIKELAGKDCSFNVEINSDNVLLQSKIFQVTDAYDSLDLSSSNIEASMPGFSNSNYSENKVDLTRDTDTPGSATSVCKKVKTEK